MRGGDIQQRARLRSCSSRPANKFVAGFLGSPPMNFLTPQSVARGRTSGCNRSWLSNWRSMARARPRSSAHSGTINLASGRPALFEDAGPDALELPIVLSEYIGAHSVLMCDCGGQQVVVELKSATPIPLGETLRSGQ
jgi:multiple sugar transport system ATP-binding protein